MIKTWYFIFIEYPDRKSPDILDPDESSRAFAWYLDLCPRLEQFGFEGVFFSEHHFFGNLSPSPNLLVAAAAGRTRHLRLGVLGEVLPLHYPFRVAEELAMLDHLTDGRLEIGYASGTGPSEGKSIGLTADEMRPRFEEALEIIDLALAEPKFSYAGKFWQIENLTITPRLRQKAPIKWMVGRSPETATLAARRGYRFCSGNSSTEYIRGSFDTYREAARAAGNPAGPDRLAIRRQTLVCDSNSEADALLKEVLPMHIERVNDLFERRRLAQSGGGDTTPMDKSYKTIDAPSTPSLMQILYSEKDEQIVGSPASVAEQIIDQCRRIGAGHFVPHTFFTLTPQEATRNYELWQDVNAILAKADIG